MLSLRKNCPIQLLLPFNDLADEELVPSKSSPEHSLYSLEVYSPSGAHKSFRIAKVYKGSRKVETIRTNDTDKVNEAFRIGAMSEADARRQMEIIRDQMLEEAGLVKNEPKEIHNDNRKDMEDYLTLKYGRDMFQLKDPASTRNEWTRAMEAIGDLSLRRASKEQVEEALSALDLVKRARVTNKINTMLKFLRRDFILNAPEKPKRRISYITNPDLPDLLAALPSHDVKALHEVAFWTGVTIGEAFALDQKSFRHGHNIIDINEQVDREGNLRQTRTKKRSALFLPEGERALLDWFHVRENFNDKARRNIARLTKQAASKAFPEQPYKQITFQDLRHSYAVNLLRASKPAPLEVVANSLGISMAAAREYYGDFAPDNSLYDLVITNLKKGS